MTSEQRYQEAAVVPEMHDLLQSAYGFDMGQPCEHGSVPALRAAVDEARRGMARELAERFSDLAERVAVHATCEVYDMAYITYDHCARICREFVTEQP